MKPLRSATKAVGNFVSEGAEEVGKALVVPQAPLPLPLIQAQLASAPSRTAAGSSPGSPVNPIISATAEKTPLALPARSPVPGTRPSNRTRLASFLSGITGGAAAGGGGGTSGGFSSTFSRKGGGKTLFGE